MAAYQKAKDKVLKANEDLDKKADSLVNRIMASKWTGVALGVAAGFALIGLLLTVSLLLK